MAPAGGASFGACMDVSGDYVIAGVAPPRAGSNSISIFTRNPVDDLVWSQQVMFTDSHDNTANLHAVAISGDYAIASYPFGGLHPGDSNGARKNDGRVKVFARNPATSTWSLQQTLSGNNHYEEFFGYAAAISGDCIVVSSDDGYPNFSSGNGNRMYIYKRDPNLGSWSLSLQQPVSIMNWYMGKHISMTDDHIIVGMKTDTGTGGTNSGAVNVYTRDGISWSLTQRLEGCCLRLEPTTLDGVWTSQGPTSSLKDLCIWGTVKFFFIICSIPSKFQVQFQFLVRRCPSRGSTSAPQRAP